MKRELRSYTGCTLGTILIAVGVYFFKLPHGLVTGGVSGIGILLGRLTPISSTLWISALSMALLAIGFLFLGKETGIRTVYCSLLYAGVMPLFSLLFSENAIATGDIMLDLIYGILLSAVGSAILFANRASSGGTDIIALLLQKHTSADVGKSLLLCDFFIALSSVFAVNRTVGLYSLLGLFAKAFVIDGVMENIRSCKYFVIITQQPEKISEYILTTLKHGVTVVQAEGGYSHEQRKILHAVCRRGEAHRLRHEVKKIDPDAFFIITTSSEIIGRGFLGE